MMHSVTKILMGVPRKCQTYLFFCFGALIPKFQQKKPETNKKIILVSLSKATITHTHHPLRLRNEEKRKSTLSNKDDVCNEVN